MMSTIAVQVSSRWGNWGTQSKARKGTPAREPGLAAEPAGANKQQTEEVKSTRISRRPIEKRRFRRVNGERRRRKRRERDSLVGRSGILTDKFLGLRR